MRPIALTLIAFCLVGNQACVTIKSEAPAVISENHLYRDNFGARPDIPNPTTLHQLSDAQLQAFDDYLIERSKKRINLHRIVYEYLLDLLQNFNYAGDTVLASLALEQRAGNCLSLAILTTALADRAGVDIKYQLVDDLPVFDLRGSLIEKGLHIRTILYEPPVEHERVKQLQLFRSGIKIDYFPSGNERFVSNLSRQDYLSLFYRNIAADALVSNDLNKAYWYTVESLSLAPNDSAALNNLAIIYRRSGDTQHAETIYQFGIKQSSNKLTLLKNYQGLLLSQGRAKEAKKIGAQLSRMDDPSPHHWYELARQANKNKNYEDAVRYFKSAIERAPYVSQLRLELAQSYYRAGDLDAAKLAMQEALDLAYRQQDRTRYEAKLSALNKIQAKQSSN